MPDLNISERQWRRYHRGLAAAVIRHRAERREALILAHLAMVDRIARQLAPVFAFAEFCDLVQAGRVGLVEAADRYSSDLGTFEQFAYLRVRGAIVDAHKRSPYRHWQSTVPIYDWLADEGRYVTDPSPQADVLAAEDQAKRRLARAISELPADQSLVLRGALAGEQQTTIACKCGYSKYLVRDRLRKAQAAVTRRMTGILVL